MADLRSRPAFAEEPGDAPGIRREMRVQSRERDALAEPDVLGLVHRRHSPFADLAVYDVLPDPIA
jgi:hypothetical protein